ncbi:MAG: hypothetical protein PHQ53_09065 [Candidatus Krumholzibacteria bacterium]|nr:hypothetical protein [Candidatus Krumholzibacteria bacterium]
MTRMHAARSAGGNWSMAHHRDASRYRVRLLLASLLLTALLAGAIRLGNAVTSLRREILDLDRACSNLEAQRAQLAVRWNTESSRQVVMRRAQVELGLVSHAAPDAILISLRDDARSDLSWPRLLQALGPLDLTPAALAGPER